MAQAGGEPRDAAGAVRLVLGGRVRTLTDIEPDTTVLNYLREVERRTGTKEGCAEGDCGACTVVLGELDGERIRYRAVNACILFLASLDGKQLITVEDLRTEEGALHPVQRALVECHGSQCGFCTPGFVMSLFALYKSEAAPGRRRIDDAIAGNLCRCTGYVPIVAAAERMYALGDDDRFGRDERATVEQLKSLRRDEPLVLTRGARRFEAPRSEDELASALARHPDACILAGGTDAGLWVTKLHQDLDKIIYVGEVPELTRMGVSESHIEIGAAVTYTDAMDLIASHYPAFGEVLRRLGSVQIRNAGTVGGNIANASPIGDTPPALIALGASVVLRRGDDRREMPLDKFFLDYRKTALEEGAFISRVRVPVASQGRSFGTYKVAKRFDQDISAVCGAYSLELDGTRVREIRICYGGMAPTPKRALRCEAALRGVEWSDASVTAAARALEEDYAPISDMRASAEYRMLVARNLLYKFYLETSRPGEAVQVLAYGT